jgi:hypothetical protein
VAAVVHTTNDSKSHPSQRSTNAFSPNNRSLQLITPIVSDFDIPDERDTPNQKVVKLFNLMQPLIDDIADQYDCLMEVVDESSHAYNRYMQLIPNGFASIGELGAAMERNSSDESASWLQIKRIFWEFLVEQLRVRSEVLQVTAETFHKRGVGDANNSLCAQTYEICRLQKLIEYFENWDILALPVQNCEQLLS